MQAAAGARPLGATPFAGFVSDPCDGRTQGTPGMMDSLPYRNDAALCSAGLSLAARRGAECWASRPAKRPAGDDAGAGGAARSPVILVPGGVTLPPSAGEDAGKVQSIGVRFAHGQLTLEEAAELGCRGLRYARRRLPVLRHGRDRAGRRRGARPSLPHAALAPSASRSGSIWRTAPRSLPPSAQATTTSRPSDRRSDPNAMWFTRPAAARPICCCTFPPSPTPPACRARPWTTGRVNRRVPRLVDALPNGPRDHPTVRVFLGGGVPEIMLHLRGLGLLVDSMPSPSPAAPRRGPRRWDVPSGAARARRSQHDGVDPDDVILSPDGASAAA